MCWNKVSAFFYGSIGVWIFSGALLVSLVAATGASAQVFGPYEGNYYQFVYGEGLTWSQARDFAAAQSYNGRPGHLATIDSEGEMSFVLYAHRGERPTGCSDGSQVWLGGFQPGGSSEPGGDWQWVTGGSVPDVHQTPDGWGWGDGEPNENGEEDCMDTHWDEWYDSPCNTTYYCMLIEYEGDEGGYEVVPTITQYGVVVLALLVAGFGVWVFRRRKCAV
jgi:hypothetical protein